MAPKPKKFNFLIFLHFLFKITFQKSVLETAFREFISEKVALAVNNTIYNSTTDTETIEYLKSYTNKSSENVSYLIEYSSRNKGELFPAKNCIKNKGYAFYTINAYNTKCEIDCPKLSYIFGLCVRNYENRIVKNMIEQINKCNDNILGFDEITIENKIENKEERKEKGFKFYFYIFYLIIFIMFIFFLLSLYSCMSNFFSKSTKDNFFLNSFKLQKNTSEFFSLEETTKINNDNGLAFIRGLRGIAIILYITGIVFIVFIKYPAKIANDDIDYFNKISGLGFFIFRYGIVNAPRLLLALSGFCCSYKFYMFLDDELRAKLDEEQRRNSEAKSLDPVTRPVLGSTSSFYDDKEETNDNNLEIEFNLKTEQDNTSNTKIEQSSENILNKAVEIETNCGNLDTRLDEQKQHLLETKHMLKFYCFQLNKIIVCVLFIFGLQFLCQLFFENTDSPIGQELYKHQFENKSYLEHLYFLLLFGNFLPKIMDNSKVETSLSTFSLIYNEIFFFVISVPVLFVIYRKRIKIRNILFLIVIFDVVRFLFYYCPYLYFYIPNDEIIKEKGVTKLKATNRFIFKNSFIDLYSKWPLFNINYYLIGILFGLMQYALQKNTGESYNGYLNIVVDLLYFIKYQSESVINIFCCIAILIIILFQLSQFFLTMINNEGTTIFFRDGYSFIDFLYLIEGNIVVILTILIPFTLYIKGSNFFTYFLSGNFWLVFNKMYFSLALSAETVIFWFFYRSDTNYQLNIFSYTYFGFVSLIIVFVGSFLWCIFIEFPLKRIIKHIIEKIGGKKQELYSALNEKDIIETVENTSNG